MNNEYPELDKDEILEIAHKVKYERYDTEEMLNLKWIIEKLIEIVEEDEDE